MILYQRRIDCIHDRINSAVLKALLFIHCIFTDRPDLFHAPRDRFIYIHFSCCFRHAALLKQFIYKIHCVGCINPFLAGFFHMLLNGINHHLKICCVNTRQLILENLYVLQI